MALKVLVVDDTVVFRRVVSEAVAAIPGVEVVGTASNGRAALRRLKELEPDLVTLDIEMPEMDGIQVLEAMKEMHATAGVIVVSALTLKGGRLTMRALSLGAFDFITKPSESSIQESREAIRTALAPRLAAFARRREIRRILGRSSAARPAAPVPAVPAAVAAAPAPPPVPVPVTGGNGNVDVVAIGVSTGGPVALSQIIPALPGDLGVPVLIVQHMPPIFTRSLAESLGSRSRLEVCEAQHLDPLRPNVVYIAPGGRHMRVAPSGTSGVLVHITDDPPENNCRPAVDYMFRSVAEHYPGRAAAVVLTGMGSDGALGLRLLKRQGAITMAQDEATCVVYGMPKAAVETGAVDFVLPLDAVAAKIASTVRGHR